MASPCIQDPAPIDNSHGLDQHGTVAAHPSLSVGGHLEEEGEDIYIT